MPFCVSQPKIMSLLKIWTHDREYQVTLSRMQSMIFMESQQTKSYPTKTISESDQNTKFLVTSDLSLIGHQWSQNVYSELFIYIQFSIEVGKHWNIISTAFVSTSIFSIQILILMPLLFLGWAETWITRGFRVWQKITRSMILKHGL